MIKTRIPTAVGAEGLCNQILKTDQHRFDRKSRQQQRLDELRQTAHLTAC